MTDAGRKAAYDSTIRRRGISVSATRKKLDETEEADYTSTEKPICGSLFKAIVYPDTQRANRNEAPPGTVTRRFVVVATMREVVLQIDDVLTFPASRVTTNGDKGAVIEPRDNQLGWEYLVEIGASQTDTPGR